VNVGETELVGMSLAIGRLTYAMAMVEEQRDNAVAEVKRLRAVLAEAGIEPGGPTGAPEG